jgi:hypothetical protein
VVGNVLWKKNTPSGGQLNFYVARFGGDGTGESHGRYRFVNNTVLMGSSAVFRLFDSLESVEMHNNVFYRPDGTGAPIIRTVEAEWTTGVAVIAGQNNWVQSGASQVPVQWTGTIAGEHPGFADLPGGDVRSAPGSPLANAGTSNPLPAPGFQIASPLFPPAFEPPSGIAAVPGTALPRTPAGVIDIGAYEATGPTGVRANALAPPGFALSQNFPNPFNSTTIIRYQSPAVGEVRLVVYDLLGREVSTLVNEQKTAGPYDVSFDGSGLSTGIYIYRLSAAHYSASRTLILMK